MSSLAPTKSTKETNSLNSGLGIGAWIMPALQSSVGSKFLVGITGFALTGFVVTHMVGNLKVFAGRDAINSYAQMLKDMGPLLWVARGGLLALFLCHLGIALKLKMRAKDARPIPYQSNATIQASIASRTMALTGLVILAFVIFHIAHFTLFLGKGIPQENGKTLNFGELKETLPGGGERHDVYNMVVYGFKDPVISILYIVAQFLLLVHLSHGIPSIFQTFGLNSPRTQGAIRGFGWSIAFLVFLGNCAIVFAIWSGKIQPILSN